MNNFSIKKVFGKGLLIAIPLGVVIYIGKKIFEMFEKVVEPLSKQFGIQKIFGELSVTILVVFILIILVFILGLLMRVTIFASFGKRLEELVFYFVPSLNQLKVTAAEKLKIETESETWRPVLVLFENRYQAGYIVDHIEDYFTLFVIKGIDISQGEILIVKKEVVQVQDITVKELNHFTKQYGKGFLSLIKKS